ncbi:MAG: OB-fold nucleic acid binding domain-containing protein [Elusimicrobiota bacterium]|nr:MAG: OB-fold nucleic acid binding domain-containing protein [Elusimicrobiota bacterium]
MRALALLLLALPASAETITAAGDLIKDRETWDGHSACAAGRVVELDERFGRVTGKHLFRAKIDDGTGVVQVFAFGHFPKLAPGERIEACGRFNKAKLHKNGVTYENEIEAVVVLRGAGVGAGLVDIIGDRVVPRARGKASAQSAVPPAPK